MEVIYGNVKNTKNVVVSIAESFLLYIGSNNFGCGGCSSTVLALDGANPTVEIVGFMRATVKTFVQVSF